MICIDCNSPKEDYLESNILDLLQVVPKNVLLAPLRIFQLCQEPECPSKLHKVPKRKLILLSGFQRFDLNQSSLGFSKRPDTISSFVSTHLVLKDFRKGYLEPFEDSPCPSIACMETWRTWRFLIKLGIVPGGQENPQEASQKFRQICYMGILYGLFLGSKLPLIKFQWIQILSDLPHNIHGKRWCIKNTNFTHLAKEHTLGHPVGELR